MTPGQAFLADLRARGIELETDGSRLRWRPAFLVNGPQEEQLLRLRAELIELLRQPAASTIDPCPSCQRPLDSQRRCPRCFDRLCVDCGKETGSYFLMRCVVCSYRWQAQPG